MKMLNALVVMSVFALNACATTETSSGINRSQVQSDCSKQYQSVTDEMSRLGKIKACMRARGAL